MKQRNKNKNYIKNKYSHGIFSKKFNNKLNFNFFNGGYYEEYDEYLNPVNGGSGGGNFNTRNPSFHGSDIDDDGRIVSHKKRGFTWAIMGSILGSLLLGGAIAGITLYILNHNRSSSSSNNTTSGISNYYRKSTSQDSIDAMNYIYSRSISMQFLFDDPNNSTADSGVSISGTGWIFNKEKNSDTYYLATNLHVAAALTYSGKVFIDNGQTQDFTNKELIATYIGFINPSSSDSKPVYSDADLNMLRVTTPEIVYTSTTFSDTNGFSNDYTSILNTDNLLSTYRQGMVDFALLKFNFNSLNLQFLNNNQITSNSANVNLFTEWLKSYNSEPTEFYENPIDSLMTTTSDTISLPFSSNFYMGGFPGTNNVNRTYKNSWSSNLESYLNFGQTEWEAFADFPLSVNGQGYKLDRPSTITAHNYNNFASGFNNWYDRSTVGVQFFQSTNNLQATNCINVGYQALLDASSLGGSSGSMLLIKDTDGKFKVVGIYWGMMSFENSSHDITTSVGAANFLYVNSYKVNSDFDLTWPGYNIFQFAMNTLRASNPSATFVYTPTFN